jgi:hypothetical protein
MIDFDTIQSNFDKLIDQCQRLMQTLEATRRELETVKEERDRFKHYCNLSVNYHNVMTALSQQVSNSQLGNPFGGASSRELPLSLGLFQPYYYTYK